MNEWLLFFAVLLAIPYVVVPYLIKRNHFFSKTPHIRSLSFGFLPSLVEQDFQKSDRQLQELGFEHRLDAVSLDYGPHLKVFMRLYVALEKSMVAIVTALVPEDSDGSIRSFVELSSRFVGGVEVSTSNSDIMGAPIEHKSKTISVLPALENIKILCAFHENMLKKLGVNQAAAHVPKSGSELAFLVQDFEDDIATQNNLGCLEYDADTDLFRPTWAGAILMGWYSMWPISIVRSMKQRIRAYFMLKGMKQAEA